MTLDEMDFSGASPSVDLSGATQGAATGTGTDAGYGGFTGFFDNNGNYNLESALGDNSNFFNAGDGVTLTPVTLGPAPTLVGSTSGANAGVGSSFDFSQIGKILTGVVSGVTGAFSGGNSSGAVSTTSGPINQSQATPVFGLSNNAILAGGILLVVLLLLSRR